MNSVQSNSSKFSPILKFNSNRPSVRPSYWKKNLQRIDTETAVHFLHSLGYKVSREAVKEAELLVCRELQFAINAVEPLTYVETLLEVLGENIVA